MRKRIFVIFLLTDLLFSLPLLSQTFVSGGIFTNTTWTKSNSPYIVTGSVAVFPGNTLTIEPGVEVRFDSATYLEMRDSTALYAVGTAIDSIVFTSNFLNKAMGDWSGLKLPSCDSVMLKYVSISYAVVALYYVGYPNSHEISHVRLYKNNTGIESLRITTLSHSEITECMVGIDLPSESTVSHCTFMKNNVGMIGAIDYNKVINSTFCGNMFGLDGADTVDNCVFVNNGIGFQGEFNFMSYSVFAFNEIGMKASIGSLDTLAHTNIFNNDIGWEVTSQSPGFFTYGNNICNNVSYNLKYDHSANAIFRDICWCTNDSSVIASKIYDGYDNVSLGLVDFTPYLNCSNSVLPPDPDTNCTAIDTSVNVFASESKERAVATFPNPADRELTLLSESMFDVGDVIQIWSGDGKIMQQYIIQSKSSQISIQTQELQGGLYFFRMIGSNQKVKSGKFIVNH